MSPTLRNRLFGLGLLWGLTPAAAPAFVMANPPRPDGFLLAAERRSAMRAKKSGRNPVLAGLGTGFSQALVGGGVATLLFWGTVAPTISGYAPGGAGDLSSLMRPQVFLGSFFVSLSVFLYALVGGVLPGPIFGTLVNHLAKADTKEGPR